MNRDLRIGICFGLSRFCIIAAMLLALISRNTEAAPISIEDLFKNAAVVAAQLSPDGKSVAFTTTVEGKRSLAVMDIGTSKLQELAAFSDVEIGSFSWISSDRLLYSVSYLYNDHRWSGYLDDGIYAINRDGSQYKVVMPPAKTQLERFALTGRHMQVVGLYANDKDSILVAERNSQTPGVSAFQVNTVTGRKREIDVGVSGELRQFWVDHATVIRLAKTANDFSKEDLWYRDGEGSPWKKIAQLDKLKPEFQPVAFDTDNKTLFVAAKNGGDKYAIHKFDLSKNTVGELFYANPDVDVSGGLAFARDTNRLFGIRYQGEQPGVYWLDPKREAIQNAIDDALPGQMNVVSGDEHAAGLLVYSYSDINPGRYYYYHQETHKLKMLFAARPWIHLEDLSAQAVYHYTARDGLDIPAYLTLPKGKPVKKLPLVVLVHGGPWMRDYWGYQPELQFLASRGYAVLQPQFRSSIGFGFALFNKGWQQWGLSMQDDITDGVRDLVKQGVVDGNRVCIMGASYGGYAAMMGVAKDPGLYRCAVNMFGITDIELQQKISDWADDAADEFRHYGAKELIGDVGGNAAHFDAVSPLKQAAKIKTPILMAYGDKDKRVPMAQGEKLRDVLLKQGNAVEWLTLEDEGHGLQNKAANRFLFYRTLDAFLRKYNPADE